VKLQRDFGDEESRRSAREVYDPDDEEKYLATLLAEDQDEGPILTEKMRAGKAAVEGEPSKEMAPDKRGAPDKRLHDESPTPPTPDEHLVLDVLKRARYFCADGNLSARIVALEVVAVGCTLMANSPTHLLPLVHDLWPSLRSRLPKRRVDVDAALGSSTCSFSLAATLDVMTALVRVCGDFLAFKFKDDIWPALELILAQAASRKTDAAAATAPRRRAVAAALRCARSFADHPNCAEFVIPVATQVGKLALMHAVHGGALNADAVALELEPLLRSLAALDADGIWFVCCTFQRPLHSQASPESMKIPPIQTLPRLEKAIAETRVDTELLDVLVKLVDQMPSRLQNASLWS